MKKWKKDILIAIILLALLSVGGWYLSRHPEVAAIDDAKNGRGQ